MELPRVQQRRHHGFLDTTAEQPSVCIPIFICIFIYIAIHAVAAPIDICRFVFFFSFFFFIFIGAMAQECFAGPRRVHRPCDR